MKTITITVEPDGTDRIETEGFHGEGCGALIDALSAGETPMEFQQKPEFFEQQGQQEKARS